MLCDRCGEREALSPNVAIGTTLGAFCEECLRVLALELMRSSDDDMGESGLTPEQIVEGHLRIMKKTRDLPPNASLDQIRRALGGEQS